MTFGISAALLVFLELSVCNVADFDELFASGRPKSAANEITAINFIQVPQFTTFQCHENQIT